MYIAENSCGCPPENEGMGYLGTYPDMDRSGLGSYPSMTGRSGAGPGLGFFPGFTQIVGIAGALLTGAGGDSDAVRWNYLNQILDSMESISSEAIALVNAGVATTATLDQAILGIEQIRNDFQRYTTTKGDRWWSGAWLEWAKPTSDEILTELRIVRGQLQQTEQATPLFTAAGFPVPAGAAGVAGVGGVALLGLGLLTFAMVTKKKGR